MQYKTYILTSRFTSLRTYQKVMIIILSLIGIILIESMINNNKNVNVYEMTDKNDYVFGEIKLKTLEAKYTYIDIFGLEHSCKDNLNQEYRQIYQETGKLPIRSMYGLILHLIVCCIFIYTFSHNTLTVDDLMGTTVILFIYIACSLIFTIG